MKLRTLSQIWNYFKKGRGEVGIILSLYSMMLSYSIKFDVEFSVLQYVGITVFLMIFCSFLGVFLAEKVEPENQRISPYAQDSIKTTILLQSSLINYFEGAPEKAVAEMKKAIELREKWLR